MRPLSQNSAQNMYLRKDVWRKMNIFNIQKASTHIEKK